MPPPTPTLFPYTTLFRSLGAEHARDAEVDQHDALAAEDHVLRLDVAVHDLLAVHVRERLARVARVLDRVADDQPRDRKSTRLNSSHVENSYAVFCLKKKN